jgi:hypothetical protein
MLCQVHISVCFCSFFSSPFTSVHCAERKHPVFAMTRRTPLAFDPPRLRRLSCTLPRVQTQDVFCFVSGAPCSKFPSRSSCCLPKIRICEPPAVGGVNRCESSGESDASNACTFSRIRNNTQTYARLVISRGAVGCFAAEGRGRLYII